MPREAPVVPPEVIAQNSLDLMAAINADEDDLALDIIKDYLFVFKWS